MFLQLVNILIFINSENFFISLVRMVFGGVILLLIPGYLISLTLKIRKKDPWEYLVYIVGFSTIFLIFVGLITNWVLSNSEVSEPLSSSNLIIGFNIFIILFLILAISRNKRIYITFKIPKLNITNWLLFVMPFILPVFAVLGTISLNNNNPNVFTIVMLGCIAFWVWVSYLYRKRLNRNIYPTAIYFISLSLLLMTSLRGWYTTGHDNQLEYFVFQLTKSDFVWDIAKYRDPYNASLSITILPTVFSSLLKINDVYVYKVFFQIIFSFIGVSLFLFYKRYVSKYLAFLSVFSFFSFPTFINDIPMLNRQEIAMFFFSLILLELFAKTPKPKIKKAVFYIFGLGMVTSHYSTTYIAISLFIFVYLGHRIIKRYLYKIKRITDKFINGEIIKKGYKPRLSLGLILALVFITLFWNVQLTNTTAGLNRVIIETYKNIGKTFSQDLKSGAIFYSLFSWRQLDKRELLDDYVRVSAIEASQKYDSQLYDESLYNNYKIELVDDKKKPATILGSWLIDKNISPNLLNFYLRQTVAKIIQLFILIGFTVILIKRSKLVKVYDPEYLLLILASLIMIVIFIFLPVLSLEYGAQRLFQQTLLVTSLPLVIGFFAVLGKRISIFIQIIIFLSLSGFIPYITGDFYPQLHLENKGSYFDSYLTHKSEIISINWLADNYNNNFDIYTNSPSHAKFAAVSGLFPLKGILPHVLTQKAYVYLDYTNVVKKEDSISHKGEILIYKYPIEFLELNKDLIYTNSKTIIFK